MGNKKIGKMMKLNILFLVLAHFTMVGAQLDDFCNGTDLNYQCNEPTPQDPSELKISFCNPVSNLFYDPSNCDPGHWCGCTVTNKTKCIPKLKSKYWYGHFTTNTTDTTTPVEIVIYSTYNDDENQSKCIPGMYCAGKKTPSLCPDNCPPGKVCKTAATMKDCPSGGYCPVGSIVEIKCKGLQSCNDSGLRKFSAGSAVTLIILSMILCIAGLFFLRYKITKSARVSKAEKMKKAKEKKENTAQVEQSVRKSILPVISDPIDIEFESLRLTLPNIGTIMQGASGTMKHSTITAIMGASGAGKTTMLNLLSGKADRTSGIIKINGEEREMCEFKDVIGFAPQVDTMHRNLTVEDIIIHNALMRLPVNMSKEEKLQRVDDVLEVLEIDHVRDTIIGDARVRGISGGQLKRVNIAMEMVSNPKLICLDEPTSGLDSVTSFVVLKALKEMAQTGVNVIVVLHQPKKEIFELFNQVVLLANGGLTAFIGSPIEMNSYFENLGFPMPPGSNPADFAMDVLGCVVPHATNAHFKTEDFVLAWMTADENPNAMSLEEAKSLLADAASDTVDKVTIYSRLRKVRQYFSDMWAHIASGFKKNSSDSSMTDPVLPGMFQQTILLTYRAFLQRIRSPMITTVHLILFFVLGGLEFMNVQEDFIMYKGILNGFKNSSNEDNYGVTAFLRENILPIDQISLTLSSVYIFLAMACCVSVSVLGGNERLVFFRETSTGQSVVAYFLSKVIVTLTFIPIYAAAYICFISGADEWFIQDTGSFYLFIFLTMIFMYAVGFLSSLFLQSNAGLISLVAELMILIFFSGLIFPLAISEASGFYLGCLKCFPIFWSSQGLITEEFEHYSDIFDIARLNALTNQKNNKYGAPFSDAGAGSGKGWDLGKGVGGNTGYCILALFGWYLLVLLTMKLSSFKKHR